MVVIVDYNFLPSVHNYRVCILYKASDPMQKNWCHLLVHALLLLTTLQLRMMEWWSYKRHANKRHAKLQSRGHHQQTNTQHFTGRMSFLSPSYQCWSTEWKSIAFHIFAHPKLIWGLPALSLTTKRSWLHWRRIAKSLASPLKPISSILFCIMICKCCV